MVNYSVEISLAVISLVVCAILYTWQKDKSNSFDLMDALLGEDGKASLYRIGQATALITSTWGFIVLIQQGKLTEWYFTAYMTVWAGANVVKTIFAQPSGGTNAGTNKT
jgi:hypothetical protein